MSPLDGRRVVTTRDEPGRLDELLAAAGADVVHVPLIEIVEPPDGGDDLRRKLSDLSTAHWLIVTSKHGARRCAAAAGAAPRVRLAAVGSATASELALGAGRGVDVLPDRQTAADLVSVMPEPAETGERIVLAQADLADDALASDLRGLGYAVDTVVAYSTRLRVPSSAERDLALHADAVAFASGSAARAWAGAFDGATPPVVVSIGPSTSAVASQVSLKVTHEAADHSVQGLADAVVAALSVST